jgi:hypothetical protein
MAFDDNGKTHETLVTLKEHLESEAAELEKRILGNLAGISERMILSRAHLEAVITGLEERTKITVEALTQRMLLTFELNRVAMDKAESRMDLRLSSMNEFRDSLKDQAAKFITSPEYESAHGRVVLDITALRTEMGGYITRNESKAFNDKIEKDVSFVMNAQSRAEGKASTTAVYISYVFGLIAIALTVIHFFK